MEPGASSVRVRLPCPPPPPLRKRFGRTPWVRVVLRKHRGRCHRPGLGQSQRGARLPHGLSQGWRRNGTNGPGRILLLRPARPRPCERPRAPLTPSATAEATWGLGEAGLERGVPIPRPCFWGDAAPYSRPGAEPPSDRVKWGGAPSRLPARSPHAGLGGQAAVVPARVSQHDPACRRRSPSTAMFSAVLWAALPPGGRTGTRRTLPPHASGGSACRRGASPAQTHGGSAARTAPCSARPPGPAACPGTPAIAPHDRSSGGRGPARPSGVSGGAG